MFLNLITVQCLFITAVRAFEMLNIFHEIEFWIAVYLTISHMQMMVISLELRTSKTNKDHT